MKTLRIDRSREWTVDDFLKLEESNTLCELINGALVIPPTPSPIHQNTNDNLYSFFKGGGKKDRRYSILDRRSRPIIHPKYISTIKPMLTCHIYTL